MLHLSQNTFIHLQNTLLFHKNNLLCCTGVGRLRSGSESEQRVNMRVHRSATSNMQTPELSRPSDRGVENWANRYTTEDIKIIIIIIIEIVRKIFGSLFHFLLDNVMSLCFAV